MTITDDDLSRWEALASAATLDWQQYTPGVGPGHTMVVTTVPRGHDMEEYRVVGNFKRKEDAALAAAARTAVPDLCAEVRRRNAEGEAARKHRDAERDALRAEVERLHLRIGHLDTEALHLYQQTNEAREERDAARVEASELRASLADAVGKIEVMRAESERLRGRRGHTACEGANAMPPLDEMPGDRSSLGSGRADHQHVE